MDLEKLDKDRDVREMPPEALWYDDAILHYRYQRLKAGTEKYQGWSAEDFVNLHARIVRELRRRGLAHFDRDDELDRDAVAQDRVEQGPAPGGEDGGAHGARKVA
ncbi:MAG: hypothetical protein ACK44W_18345, partial [Planctomycetota bacterium]